MWLLIFAALLAGATAEVLDGAENVDNAFEPQVAFSCGQPSMYLTEQGWKTDRLTGCQKTPQDVLAYCSKTYPKLNITNVVPASREATLAFTTSFRGFSTAPKVVRPYRCIVGEFESDSLMVPDECRFAHYEADLSEGSSTLRQCASYSDWNTTATVLCEENKMQTYSFSVILPCAVGAFGGVEYVCCPSSVMASVVPVPNVRENSSAPPTATKPTAAAEPNIVPTSTAAYDPGLQTTTEDADAEETQNYEDVSEEDNAGEAQWIDDSASEFESDEAQAAASEAEDDMAQFMDLSGERCDANKNYYRLYMDTPEQIALNEHDAYTKALSCSKQYYDKELDVIIQQLDVLEERYADLSTKNVSMAQEMRDREFKTLNQLYETTDDTWMRVKQAMYDEHQRRVEARLEDRRLDGVEAWMLALDEAAEYDDLEAIKPLMQALKKYIRTEEKQRIHWINRYEHLLDTDEKAAERIKLTVEEMLRQIQARLAAVTASLKRVPRIEATVRSLLEEFLASYADVDQEVRFLFPDFDLVAEVQNVLPSGSPHMRPASDWVDAQYVEGSDIYREPISDLRWIDDDSAVRVVSNRMLIIIVVSSVAAVLFLVGGCTVFCMYRRRARNARGLKGLSPRKCKSNIYHVPTAAIDTKEVLMSPRILVDDNLRKMQMRGYENPMGKARLELNENETEVLVNNEELQSQQSLPLA